MFYSLGAIVPPATHSNHMVGHAIDMNLIYDANGSVCDSFCMKGGHMPTSVITFLRFIMDDPQLIWGGNYTEIDVVHIDDAYYERDHDKWDCEYYMAHRYCLNETVNFNFDNCSETTSTISTTSAITTSNTGTAQFYIPPILFLLLPIITSIYHV